MPITTAGAGVSTLQAPSDEEVAQRQAELDAKVQEVNKATAEEVKPQMPVTGKDFTPEQTLREVVSASDRGPTIANPASQPIIDSKVMQTAAKQQVEAKPPSEEELASRLDTSTGVQVFKPAEPKAEATDEAEPEPAPAPESPATPPASQPQGYQLPPLS